MDALRRFLSLQTPKFRYMKRAMGDRPFRLLDVGSANRSPSKAAWLFPRIEYHGLDLSQEGYGPEDRQAMKKFFQIDLCTLHYEAIEDQAYDYINMSHIIEHLPNGEEVLAHLAPKLKSGGYLYIEYPGEKSTRLPSRPGTLNFHDDPTHQRVYSVGLISRTLEEQGFEILDSGTRKSWAYILAMPFQVLRYGLRGQKAPGPIFWDWMGFAEFVYARKK